MRAFLAALAGTASVTDAARAVGMSRQSAYQLRARLVGTPFDVAWEVALEHGLQQLAHAALERAIHGVARPHYFQGEKVGEHRVYSESLTRFLLANPERIGRHHIARDWYSRRWDSLLDRVETGDLDWNFKPEEEETAKEKHANQDKFHSFVMDETHYFRDAPSEAGPKKWPPR